MMNKKLIKHTYLVNYSSEDGRSYGVTAVSYCRNEAHALQKAKQDLMRTNPKAEHFRFAIANS